MQKRNHRSFNQQKSHDYLYIEHENPTEISPVRKGNEQFIFALITVYALITVIRDHGYIGRSKGQ